MRKLAPLSAAAILAALYANPALAHHAMGGDTPDGFVTGLLSGLGHPIIGVDHLAFIVAMGIAAAFTGNRYLSPLAFVLATLGGCVLQLGGIALPLPELVIAGSVVLLGALVLSGRKHATGLYLAVFAGAGLFHGWAYGESIIGAETTPLLTYMAGFAAIQYLIAIAAGGVVLWIWRAADPAAVKPRLAGAVVAGIGAAFLIENVEALLFAS